ncbi:aromatic-ring-hydroxylating dioxygenase subunit alpha [Pigmentiphaga soli]|uniref:Aromatic-ring-hydroxylating dioxygenase subunit alpha n=1 Tax=Pigmentiphaga soli TaxID=1007095 RepID=A0ABP8GRT0_9BURK
MDLEEIERLVEDDRHCGIFRVHRKAFVDPAIFVLERDRVFDRCWLYAGHESEVASPGDFITRKVGGRPLLLVRNREGRVGAFVNACSHRGNAVCREKSGNARSFNCFYHAWTFDLDGKLIGVPGADAYSEAFDAGEHGLSAVPRFESYRGLMFVCFDKEAVDLASYLGPEARQQIDYVVDSAGSPAELEVVQGAQAYGMRANWKLLVENSIDSYHGIPTHQRFFKKYLNDLGIRTNVDQMARPGSAGRALGNGHAVSEKAKHNTALEAGAAAELAERRRRIEAEHGVDYAHQACDFDRNVFIFPNLILISTWRTVRTFYPVAPDYMEIEAWGLMPKSDSPTLRAQRFQNFISFLGPAGFGTPDDVSALEGCQRGYAAWREAPWSDISRGMKRAAPIATDELQMRAFWRRWHALMLDRKGDTDCTDRAARPTAALA